MRINITYNTETSDVFISKEQENKIVEFFEKEFGLERMSSGVDISTKDRDIMFVDEKDRNWEEIYSEYEMPEIRREIHYVDVVGLSKSKAVEKIQKLIRDCHESNISKLYIPIQEGLQQADVVELTKDKLYVFYVEIGDKTDKRGKEYLEKIEENLRYYGRKDGEKNIFLPMLKGVKQVVVEEKK